MTELSSAETAERVHRFMAELARGDRLTVTYRELAEALGIGRETAHRAVVRLIRDGRVAVVRRGTGRFYPTTYSVWGPS